MRQLPGNLNMYLPFEMRISLLNIFQRKIKTYVHTTIYTGIIITALLLIAQNLSQSKCPSTNCGISNNELLFSKKEWTNDTNDITDTSQKHYVNQKKTQKGTHCMALRI